MGSGAVSLSIPAATFAGPAITAIVVIAGQPVEVVWDRQASGPPAPSNDADADGLPDDWERSVGLDPTSGAGDNGPDGDPDHDGRANRDELAAGTHPKGVFKRYLAEGATSDFFATRLALLNPGDAPAHAWVQYQKADGSTQSSMLLLPSMSRATIDVGDVAGMARAEFSTAIESDAAIIVDRTMSWDRQGYGSHAETAVAAPALTWYLAEGATHTNFNLFYLLQNPNSSDAVVRVRYLRPSGPPLEKTYTLRPRSRTNIWVDVEEFDGLGAALSNTDVSAVFEVQNDAPIIVERAMYSDVPGQTFGAGHESAAVIGPARQWFLAEGATGPYFDLFVLVANPTSTDAEIEATYLLQGGGTLLRRYTVKANSRFNIWVDLEDSQLADAAVSTMIRSVNDVPVIVERAMWWPGPTADTWAEAHNSAGATTTGTRWALAEGEVDASRGIETYVLVANTSSRPATVKVTLLFQGGGSATRTYENVPGNSRFNVPVATFFPESPGKRFGAIVESLGPAPADIVVERAMYTSALSTPWAAATNALATRL